MVHMINHKNINLLNGMCKDPIKECEEYENRICEAGGIDLFLCGIGSDGHIAFNEPDSSMKSLTRNNNMIHNNNINVE